MIEAGKKLNECERKNVCRVEWEIKREGDETFRYAWVGYYEIAGDVQHEFCLRCVCVWVVPENCTRLSFFACPMLRVYVCLYIQAIIANTSKRWNVSYTHIDRRPKIEKWTAWNGRKYQTNNKCLLHTHVTQLKLGIQNLGLIHLTTE